MKRSLLIVAGLVLSAAPALGQSINIKFGDSGAPAPDSTYGAIGPAGHWNVVNQTGPAFLRGLDGNLTSVANFVPEEFGSPFTFQPTGPTGNDALLLNSFYAPPLLESEFTVSGLDNGQYNAIFYGLSPSPLGFMVIGGDEGETYLLGEWQGQLAPGVYGIVPMSVTDGSMFISISVGYEGGAWSGMQIVQVSGPGCTADANGDGDSGTDADIEAFFACLGGSCCSRCSPADFNGDGDSGTDADIESFFRVLAGHPC